MLMHARKPFSLFESLRRRVLASERLRFLFFVEEWPKHRVMDEINIFFLAFLSLGCFLGGLFGFIVWLKYTLFGFLLYYAVLLIVLLEAMHYLYDR